MERQFDAAQSKQVGIEFNTAAKLAALKDSELAKVEGDLEKMEQEIEGLKSQQSDPAIQTDEEMMADIDKKITKAIADKASLSQKAGAYREQLIKLESQEKIANANMVKYLEEAQQKEKTTSAITKAKIKGEGSREVIATDAKGNKARVLVDSKGKIIKVIKEL
jgi:hypothetical protein